MKYLVSIWTTNKETYDISKHEETHDDRNKAYDRFYEILDSLPEEEFAHYKKVCPVITCRCGEEIVCDAFTNTCDNCEADYNFNGDLLADRSQWGEETGENWQDCY